MPVIFFIVFLKSSFFHPDRKKWKKCTLSITSAMRLLKIGVPVAGQNIVEVATFSIGSIMAGWFGAVALAANQIVLSLTSFTYMVASGFATAATIKVSHLRGQEKIKHVKNAVFATLHQVFLFMGVSIIVFILFRYKIPSLFIHDEEVIAIAAVLMLIAGLYQFFDGMQVVLLGALRGFEDVKIPMFIETGVYFFVALPICYTLAFVFNMGAAGIWTGYLAGLFLVSMILFARFNYISTKSYIPHHQLQ
jgi:MATE family multidrug resistance protein